MASLLEIRNVTKHFPVKKGVIFQKQIGTVRAVDGVSLTVDAGETVGLVGESGSGKTTVGKMILGLYEPTSGQILFKGQDISTIATKIWCRSIGAVFQDPFCSLDPRMNVASILREPMAIHRYLSRAEQGIRVGELLNKVGLREEEASKYPHQFSGGQRQRIAIARALTLSPELVIADEAVQRWMSLFREKIVNLLMDLQDEFGLSYVFIGHDLNVVRQISDRIVVMYLGKVVESGMINDIFEKSRHPYTKALIAAIPIANPEIMRSRERSLQGEIPSAMAPPQGCHFNTRCVYAKETCRLYDPELVEVEPGHFVSCHFQDEIQSVPS